LIITTNYDQFIERAFDAAGRPYHLVVNMLDEGWETPKPLWFSPGTVSPSGSEITIFSIMITP
jgi:hypothetical protein